MSCPIGNSCAAERPAMESRAGPSEAGHLTPWTAALRPQDTTHAPVNRPIGSSRIAERPAMEGRAARSAARHVAPWTAAPRAHEATHTGMPAADTQATPQGIHPT